MMVFLSANLGGGSYVIDTENLTKKFGNITAVEDLTLHVDEGDPRV
jgi:ABC-type branched-subunit amino acid transport system ATPase component